MLNNRGYLIGDDFAQRLKDTVKRVEGMPYGDGPTRLETRFEEVPLPPTNFRIGTFGTAAWSINSSNTVTLTNVGVTGYTVLATNIFGTINAMGSTLAGTTRPCAVAKDGTAWYLIQPVPSTGGAKAGTFTGGWGMGADKAVTSIETGEVINVTNLIYSIPDTGSTLACIVVQEGTAWKLANVQHRGTSVLTKVAIEGGFLKFDRAGIQVVGETSSPTTFTLASCDTYSGGTTSAVVAPSGIVTSGAQTSFFLG
jgi:hypothetical protein